MQNKLKVYLAPFLHGMRYTSFGRHFTKVEKLEEVIWLCSCFSYFKVTQHFFVILLFWLALLGLFCKVIFLEETCSYGHVHPSHVDTITYAQDNLDIEKIAWLFFCFSSQGQ